jgi:hypothetical protein
MIFTIYLYLSIDSDSGFTGRWVETVLSAFGNGSLEYP